MQKQEDLSFKDLFVPLTARKSIVYIVIIGFATFFNMLFNNFVWDDISYIVKNPEIYTINLPLYFRPNIFNNNGQYRALIELYFAVLYNLFHLNPFYYHLIQLIIHIAASILVFLFLKKFFKQSLSLLLALIFLVHPMQVESVSYIASTGCSLFLLAGMPSLLLLTRKSLSKFEFSLIGLSLLASLFIREAGLLILIVCVAYVVLFNRKHLKGVIYASITSLAAYFFFRFAIGQIFYDSRPLVPLSRLTLLQRMLNIPAIIFYYIKTFIFPYRLLIDQQWSYDKFTLYNFTVPLIILSAIFIPLFFYSIKLIMLKKPSGKAYLFFFIWTVAGFGMFSQLMTLDRTVADRWMYFPMAGLLGLIGCLYTYTPAIKGFTKPFSIILMLSIVLLSLRTIRRNADWIDGITLYTHDTQYYTNYIMENDFAGHLTDAGDYKNALFHQKKSVAMFPFEQNVLNLGRIYELSGNVPEAKKYYQQALRTPSYLAWNHKHIIHSYTHLAKVLLLEDKSQEAIGIINEGLEDYKNDRTYMASPSLWLLLAIADSKSGDMKGAIYAAEQAHKTLPDDQLLNSLYIRLLNNEKIDYDPYFTALLI